MSAGTVNSRCTVDTERGIAFSATAFYDLMRAVNEKGIPFRFRARGYSMSPFIKDGDVITIAPLSSKGPLLGDVVPVYFPDSGSLLVHRVVARRGEICILKGDNSHEPDGHVPRSGIPARVIEVRRNGVKRQLGMGPERFLIALLSRTNLLLPVLLPYIG